MKDRVLRFALLAIASVALAGCGGGGGGGEPAKGQASLEVYAELQQSGIAAISQMPDGQLIMGYHPFYVTPTSVQIATLNADHPPSRD